MACAGEELAWYRQLGRLAGLGASRVKPEGGHTRLQRYSREEAKSEGHAFELADAMEQGLAQELTACFTTARAQEEPMRCLTVDRSMDKTEHVLKGEQGEPLLVARGPTDGSCIDLYLPTGGDPPLAFGPAFKLIADDEQRDSWTLISERCECCESRCWYQPSARACDSQRCRQDLAYIRHGRVTVGRGMAQCMEVDLPTVRQDGTPAIWCTRSGGKKDIWRLESRRPRWSRKLRTLTLDFRGRCSCASAKNIQLQTAGVEWNDKDDSDLLFGKVDANSFALDFRHPLGAAQAFAIALTTKEWH